MKLPDDLEKYKPLLAFQPGEFVLANHPKKGDNLKPVIHYVGDKFITASGVAYVWLLSLCTWKWHVFAGTMTVNAEPPELTDEQRVSVVPYVDLQPSNSSTAEFWECEEV